MGKEEEEKLGTLRKFSWEIALIPADGLPGGGNLLMGRAYRSWRPSELGRLAPMGM